MGKVRIKQTTKRTYRKSQATTDSTGRVHCKTCGAFLGNKGKKRA